MCLRNCFMLEIERKFLLAQLPADLEPVEASRIQQGYLALEPEREVRIRQQDGVYTLTVKEGTGLSRRETEIGLQQGQFEVLWPVTAGRRIDKVRHLSCWQGHPLCIDVYGDDLAGLLILEVEFGSEAASQAFQPPPYAGEEITAIGSYFQLAEVLRKQRS